MDPRYPVGSLEVIKSGRQHTFDKPRPAPVDVPLGMRLVRTRGPVDALQEWSRRYYLVCDRCLWRQHRRFRFDFTAIWIEMRKPHKCRMQGQRIDEC